jgi:hypothetical protein
MKDNKFVFVLLLLLETVPTRIQYNLLLPNMVEISTRHMYNTMPRTTTLKIVVFFVLKKRLGFCIDDKCIKNWQSQSRHREEREIRLQKFMLYKKVLNTIRN